MILYNPTQKEIKVKIKGWDYSIEPYGELEINDEHGEYWVNNLHQFLIAKKQKESAKKKVEEVKEDVNAVIAATDDVSEEPAQEITEGKKTSKK